MYSGGRSIVTKNGGFQKGAKSGHSGRVFFAILESAILGLPDSSNTVVTILHMMRITRRCHHVMCDVVVYMMTLYVMWYDCCAVSISMCPTIYFVVSLPYPYRSAILCSLCVRLCRMALCRAAISAPHRPFVPAPLRPQILNHQTHTSRRCACGKRRFTQLDHPFQLHALPETRMQALLSYLTLMCHHAASHPRGHIGICT